MGASPPKTKGWLEDQNGGRVLLKLRVDLRTKKGGQVLPKLKADLKQHIVKTTCYIQLYFTKKFLNMLNQMFQEYFKDKINQC